MNWLLPALVCVAIIGAPRRPDHFEMRFALPEWETKKEHADCVRDQVKHQMPARFCLGAVTM